MQLLVKECFFPDFSLMLHDEQFKTNGAYDPNKVAQHVANAQANFSAVINSGKCAYEEKNFPHAFVIFSLVESSFLNLLSPEKNRNKPARAGCAVAQSYLGLMHKNGLGVMANNQEACKLFESEAIFLGNYHQFEAFIVPFLPICGDAVYELSRMYQYGEGVEVNLGRVLCYLDSAAQQGHKIAANKLKIAIDDDDCAQYTQPGYVKFIQFMEAEQKQLAPENAHIIAKIFIGKDKRAPYLKIKEGYKWLAIAACGGCLDAKYDLAVLLLSLGSFRIGSGYDGLSTSFLKDYVIDSNAARNEHNASVKVIAFCLLSDAAAQDHVQSYTKMVELSAYQMPDVTMVKPISWHLKNACTRLPLVAKYKFPELFLASEMDNRVLEIFLCCGDLPTEVITIIFEKMPLFLLEHLKKS